MQTRRRLCLLYLCAILTVVYSLSPIYNLFSISLMDPSQTVAGQLFPPTPTLGNYLRIFGLGVDFEMSSQLRQGFVNSIIVAMLVMVTTVAACLPAGYALGRLRLRGRFGLIGLLLAGRLLPPVTISLPFYLFFSHIGLRGKIPGIVLVQLSITLPVVAWVFMGFFGSLPRDVEQQARADGCTRFQAFRYALLPLAAPGIAASAAIAFLFSWNDFLFSLLLTSGTPAQTYNTYLSALQGEPSILAAAIAVQVIVAIVVAGFLQKYITSLKILDPGTTIGTGSSSA